jgi:hypothetical protein
MLALRLPAAALLLIVAAASGPTNADTTLRLRWGNPEKTCVFTTNNDNVSMDPANGDLLAKGSFASSDCPAGSVPVGDPVITNGLDASELPSPVTVGATASINWAATADSCSYANSSFPVALAEWPTTGSGATACSGSGACATNHTANVTFSQTGTYTFSLVCSKTGASNTATSTRTVIVEPPVASGCVAPGGLTRLTSGTVKYNTGASRITDLTLFENVFGHDQEGGPLRLFPGTRNINQRIMIPRNNYVALKFTVPANFNSQTMGQFRLEETDPGASTMSLTISKSCGDFATTPTLPMTDKCILNGGPLNSALTWGNVGLTARCQLQAGETYYLNIIHARLGTITTPACPGTSCGNVIQNEKTGTSDGVWPAAVDDGPVGE